MKLQELRQIIREEISKSLNENYLDRLLDKILDQGIESLNDEEKQALNQFSSGKNVKSPEEVMQELFNKWKQGEIEVGNDELENIYDWEDINELDKNLKQSFINYTALVKQYPNIDKGDLAIVSSIGNGILAGDELLQSTIEYTEHQDDFFNLDEKTYYNILKNYFKIDIKKTIDNLDKDDKIDPNLIKSNPKPAEQIEILKKLKWKSLNDSIGGGKYIELIYKFIDGTSYTSQPYSYIYVYRDKKGTPIKTFKNFKDFLLSFKEKKMKKQINEIKRMQQLAGIIKESQLNEAEKTVSFGPFTNVEWYKVGGENTITLIVTNSDNFRKIENAMDFEDRDYMTDEEISYLNGKVEEIADEMSDYLTSIGIENEVSDNPIGYGQEIDNLVIDIDVNDFDKLK